MVSNEARSLNREPAYAHTAPRINSGSLTSVPEIIVDGRINGYHRRRFSTRNTQRAAATRFSRFLQQNPISLFPSRAFREIRVFSFAALLTRPDRKRRRRKKTHVHAEVRGKNLANGNRESRAQ